MHEDGIRQLGGLGRLQHRHVGCAIEHSQQVFGVEAGRLAVARVATSRTQRFVTSRSLGAADLQSASAHSACAPPPEATPRPGRWRLRGWRHAARAAGAGGSRPSRRWPWHWRPSQPPARRVWPSRLGRSFAGTGLAALEWSTWARQVGGTTRGSFARINARTLSMSSSKASSYKAWASSSTGAVRAMGDACEGRDRHPARQPGEVGQQLHQVPGRPRPRRRPAPARGCGRASSRSRRGRAGAGNARPPGPGYPRRSPRAAPTSPRPRGQAAAASSGSHACGGDGRTGRAAVRRERRAPPGSRRRFSARSARCARAAGSSGQSRQSMAGGGTASASDSRAMRSARCRSVTSARLANRAARSSACCWWFVFRSTARFIRIAAISRMCVRASVGPGRAGCNARSGARKRISCRHMSLMIPTYIKLVHPRVAAAETQRSRQVWSSADRW